ncbi:MAG: recombinase XerD [Nitrososphaera sp.]|nr:recombinase XerD [Nitrososphaera sp.]
MPQKTPRKTRPPGGFPVHRCSTPLAMHCKQFIDWAQTHGYSEATLKGWSRFLILFCLWCQDRGLMRAHEVSGAVLDRYQRYLFLKRKSNGDALTLKSQCVQLWCLRSFFRWMQKQKHLSNNPALEMVLPKLGKPLPRRTLSQEEAEKVLSGPDTSTATGLRDRTILEVFYSTGIRRSELAYLKLGDVDLDGKKLTVRKGKNKKDRVVPLGQRATHWLRRYIGSARLVLAGRSEEPWLFMTLLGQNIRPMKLGDIVRNFLKKGGIEGAGACHVFRHTCATLMLDNGADIRMIQELLGHEDLSSTQLYTRVSIGKLEQVHAATHPSEVAYSRNQERAK